MTLPQAAALFVAAILGGGLNAVAGGGSFITFPTLIFTGVPGITASETNTVALWPGSLASTGAYRRELRAARPALLIALGGASLTGGVVGALWLLHTPPQTFERLIPFLLLIATLLFTFSKPLTTRLRALGGGKDSPLTRRSLAGIVLLQFVVAVYGGFFGGGIGILMLALLGMLGLDNIHTMNALKTLLAVCINGMAVATFVVAGAVLWPQAIVMVVGAVMGGYGMAAFARRINPMLVRRFVVFVGFSLTLYFFLRP